MRLLLADAPTDAVHSEGPPGVSKYSLPTVVAGITPCAVHTFDWMESAKTPPDVLGVLTFGDALPGADRAPSVWVCGWADRRSRGSEIGVAACIRAGVPWVRRRVPRLPGFRGGAP